jgi:hypothetical protein
MAVAFVAMYEGAGGRVGDWGNRAGEGSVIDVVRRKKEILILPLVPQKLSLASSLHHLPCPLCRRWQGDR